MTSSNKKLATFNISRDSKGFRGVFLFFLYHEFVHFLAVRSIFLFDLFYLFPLFLQFFVAFFVHS